MVDSGEGVRWGIVGTGGIARAFAKDLALLPDAVVGAVGSRSAEGADQFAAYLDEATGNRLPDAHRHASYDALVSDDTIDAIYVATPHPGHADAARLALEAGKAVLVEKPFTLNAAEAQELVDLARSKGLFLMEAMWTRFLPHMARVREILAAGSLGELVTVTADHGQWFQKDPEHRLFAPELGGGALLDLGDLPCLVQLVRAGHAGARHRSRVRSLHRRRRKPRDPGVRRRCARPRQHDAVGGDGQRRGHQRHRGAPGDRPYVVHAHDFCVTARDGQVVERYDQAHEGHGLRHQAAEVGRCLAAGALESPLLPLDETVAIMRTLDEILRPGWAGLPAGALARSSRRSLDPAVRPCGGAGCPHTPFEVWCRVRHLAKIEHMFEHRGDRRAGRRSPRRPTPGRWRRWTSTAGWWSRTRPTWTAWLDATGVDPWGWSPPTARSTPTPAGHSQVSWWRR